MARDLAATRLARKSLRRHAQISPRASAALLFGMFALALLTGCGQTSRAAANESAGPGATTRSKSPSAGVDFRTTVSSHPVLRATVTKVVFHKPPPYGPATVTITFTIGEPGKHPGSGVPKGSVFDVLATGKNGTSFPMVQARGVNGHFRVTVRVPAGGLGRVNFGGWLNIPTGSPTAKGGYLIPVVVSNKLY